MHTSFAEKLLELLRGKLCQQREVINYSLSGDMVNNHLQFAALQTHEARWDQLLISMVDITAPRKGGSTWANMTHSQDWGTAFLTSKKSTVCRAKGRVP